MRDFDVVIVGAGIGGLSTAMRLAARGVSVLVVERRTQLGGKMATVSVADRELDAGPTVLTMQHVFEDAFADCGRRLEDFVQLRPLDVLARHAWPDGSTLDLFRDRERSASAIADLAGPREADGYRRFCAHVAEIHRRVEPTFMGSAKTTILQAVRRAGIVGAWGLLRVDWQRSLWQALGSFFRDPRLRQLFGRYATYYGCSPFEAPATLGVIAHVEQEGVWRVEGGIGRLASAMGEVLRSLGAEIMLGADVDELLVEAGRVRGVRLRDGTRVDARAVVFNGDPSAVGQGLLGDAVRDAVQPAAAPRSLSAITFAWVGRPRGLDLEHHTVFFSRDYAAEFRSLFTNREVPREPTVYVCAQDRGAATRDAAGPERLFGLVNAPAIGDAHDFGPEIARVREATFDVLARGGLHIDVLGEHVTTPTDFAAMFPGTGGALYGPATHSAKGVFARPGERARMPGLFLVGGGVHPGAGVPMVAMGGRFAAEAVLQSLGVASSKPAASSAVRSSPNARF